MISEDSSSSLKTGGVSISIIFTVAERAEAKVRLDDGPAAKERRDVAVTESMLFLRERARKQSSCECTHAHKERDAGGICAINIMLQLMMRALVRDCVAQSAHRKASLKCVRTDGLLWVCFCEASCKGLRDTETLQGNHPNTVERIHGLANRNQLLDGVATDSSARGRIPAAPRGGEERAYRQLRVG